MRDGLLFLHILGAAAWIGGGLFGVYAYSAVAHIGPPAAGTVLAAFEKRGSLYFGLSAGLVLLSGIGLVLTSDAFGWGDTFVLIGLGALLLSGIVQSTIGRKANERLLEAGNTGSDLPSALRSWQRVTIWDVLVLLVVVWAMITKLGA